MAKNIALFRSHVGCEGVNEKGGIVQEELPALESCFEKAQGHAILNIEGNVIGMSERVPFEKNCLSGSPSDHMHQGAKNEFKPGMVLHILYKDKRDL